MKIYIKHLLEVCGFPKLEIDQLVESLTMAGLEVESISPPIPKLNNVVVGKVLTVEKHPNADRLHICKVDVGYAEPLNIVCGAQNVKNDLSVVVALEGAILPNGMEIKKAMLRGIESCGMICSAKELGLSQESTGILELAKEFSVENLPPLGEEIYPYIKDKNRYIELSITPNRGDCLSVLGIAREVAINNKISLNKLQVFPAVTKKICNNGLKCSVVIKAPEACPHYAARVVRNIKPKTPTPEYIKTALILNGINPKSLVVDIINYVMLECGQPMHAFDLNKISEGIVVRYAHKGEKITLLDGKGYDLNQSDTLVIADQHKPVALAGIMGGLETAIDENTTDILLESAFFMPEKIAITSQHYGVTTDSSSRFSRGVDPELQIKAIDFVTSLLEECVGIETLGKIIDATSEQYLPKKLPINLREARIERVLGINIADKEVMTILKSLDMKVAKISDGWNVLSPSYRFDINQEIDLIEELGRVYGYAQIPSKKPMAELALENLNDIDIGYEKLSVKRVKSLLVDRGYREIVTYSFIDSRLQTLFAPHITPIRLNNPISQEMDVMRTSLLPGLVSTLLYNQNHQQTRMRLFETGMCFIKDVNELVQKEFISGLAVGENYPLQWGEAKRHTDFFDIKSDIEALLALSNNAFVFEKIPDDINVVHHYKSATISLIKNNTKTHFGYCGELHPEIKQKLKIKQNVYLFELELSALKNTLIPVFSPISKFPSISRDLAIIVDEKNSAQEIRENVFTTIKRFSEETGISLGKNIYQTDTSMVIFDTYQGEGIAKGKKSLALSLTFQHFARTLQDEEINKLMDLIINELEKNFQAILRA